MIFQNTVNECVKWTSYGAKEIIVSCNGGELKWFAIDNSMRLLEIIFKGWII